MSDLSNRSIDSDDGFEYAESPDQGAFDVFEECARRHSKGDLIGFAALLRSQSVERRERIRALLDGEQFLENLAENQFCADSAGFGPGTRVGDYCLVRQIGRGGMGVVWEAEQPKLNRRVALKFLREDISLKEISKLRLSREARAGAAIFHTAIVQVYDYGVWEDKHYIVQELVRGGRTLVSLVKHWEREQASSMVHYRKLAELFREIAAALNSAHDVGVIHRDIKPDNILINEKGRPKVSDFGLAKVDDGLNLTENAFLGTPHYSSPEQIAQGGAELDCRTDIFSLGATLYEALTYIRAFHGDREQVIQRIRSEDPFQPNKVRSSIPIDLALICMKALEKDPARRYQAMSDFEGDLGRFLNSEPIDAKPCSISYRTVKWMRRHPVLSVSLATTVFWNIFVVFLLLQVQMKEAGERNANERHVKAVSLLLPDPGWGASKGEDVAELEKILEHLGDAFDSLYDEKAQTRFVKVLGKLAYLMEDRGGYDYASRCLGVALEKVEGLLNDRPRHIDLQKLRGDLFEKLGRVHINAADVAFDVARMRRGYARAFHALSRCLEIRHSLAFEHPDLSILREDLALAYGHVAHMVLRLEAIPGFLVEEIEILRSRYDARNAEDFFVKERALRMQIAKVTGQYKPGGCKMHLPLIIDESGWQVMNARLGSYCPTLPGAVEFEGDVLRASDMLNSAKGGYLFAYHELPVSLVDWRLIVEVKSVTALTDRGVTLGVLGSVESLRNGETHVNQNAIFCGLFPHNGLALAHAGNRKQDEHDREFLLERDVWYTFEFTGNPGGYSVEVWPSSKPTSVTALCVNTDVTKPASGFYISGPNFRDFEFLLRRVTFENRDEPSQVWKLLGR